ncbi:hypothetical protein ACOSP7_005737 [Xanthoceras sorbifolium]
MMGSFLSRALLMVFGYAYPAYECFKAVEKKNQPQTEHLLFWCHYWILVAMFSVGERLGDAFISWLPMYSEAKLAFLIYLWYPKTKGTAYVYNSWLRPYIAKHETGIDRSLLDLKIKAREIGLIVWKKAEGYGQTRFLEIMHYISSRSSLSQTSSDQYLYNSASNSTDRKQSSKQLLLDSRRESVSWKNHEQPQEAGHLPTSTPSRLQPTAATQSSKNVTSDHQSASEPTGLETMPPPIEPVSSSPEADSRNRNSFEQDTGFKRLIRQTRGKWRIFRVSSN